MPEKQVRSLHKKLIDNTNLDISYEQFASDMQDEKKAYKLYGTLKENTNLDVEFEQFKQDMSLKKKVPTSQKSAWASDLQSSDTPSLSQSSQKENIKDDDQLTEEEKNNFSNRLNKRRDEVNNAVSSFKEGTGSLRPQAPLSKEDWRKKVINIAQEANVPITQDAVNDIVDLSEHFKDGMSSGEQLGRSLTSGSISALGATLSLPATLADGLLTVTRPLWGNAVAGKGASKEQMDVAQEALFQAATIGTNPLKGSAEIGELSQKMVDDVMTEMPRYEAGILESWKSGDKGSAFQQTGNAIAQTLPTLALLYLTGGSGAATGARAFSGLKTFSTIGSMAYSRRFNELTYGDNDGQKFTKAQIQANALGNGLVEGLSETITGGIMSKWMSPLIKSGAGEFGVKKAAKKVGEGMFDGIVMEGFVSEAAIANTGQNITDVVTGVDPDRGVFEGFWDSAIVGSAVGAGIPVAGTMKNAVKARLGSALSEPGKRQKILDNYEQIAKLEKIKYSMTDKSFRAAESTQKKLLVEANKLIEENNSLVPDMSVDDMKEVINADEAIAEAQKQKEVAPDDDKGSYDAVIEDAKSRIDVIKNKYKTKKDESVQENKQGKQDEQVTEQEESGQSDVRESQEEVDSDNVPQDKSKAIPKKSVADQFTTEDVGSIEGGKSTTIENTDVVFSETDDKVSLESIRTKEGERGKGSARRAMENFTSAADKLGKKIELRIAPEDSSVSPEKLQEFYQEFGFEKEGDIFVREPKDWYKRADEKLLEWKNAVSEQLGGGKGTLGATPLSAITDGAFEVARKTLKATGSINSSVEKFIEHIESKRRLTPRERKKMESIANEVFGEMNETVDVSKTGELSENELTAIKDKINEVAEKEQSDKRSRVFENIEEIKQKARERAKTQNLDADQIMERSYNDVLGYLQGTQWYESATDTQRESAVRELRKGMGIKQESSPGVRRILGRKDKQTPLSKESNALIDQIKMEARAARDADLSQRRAKQDAMTAIVDEIKTIEGRLSKAKTNAVLNKIKNTNFLNQSHVNELYDYVDKQVRDSNKNYHQKLIEDIHGYLKTDFTVKRSNTGDRKAKVDYDDVIVRFKRMDDLGLFSKSEDELTTALDNLMQEMNEGGSLLSKNELNELSNKIEEHILALKADKSINGAKEALKDLKQIAKEGRTKLKDLLVKKHEEIIRKSLRVSEAIRGNSDKPVTENQINKYSEIIGDAINKSSDGGKAKKFLDELSVIAKERSVKGEKVTIDDIDNQVNGIREALSSISKDDAKSRELGMKALKNMSEAIRGIKRDMLPDERQKFADSKKSNWTKRFMDGVGNHLNRNEAWRTLLDKIDRGSRGEAGNYDSVFDKELYMPFAKARNKNEKITIEMMNKFAGAGMEIFGGKDGVKKWYQNKMDNRIVGEFVDANGNEVVLEYSEGRAMYVYSVTQMEGGRQEYYNIGYTDDMIDAIVDSASKEGKEFTDWLRTEFYPEYYKRVNEVYQRMNYMPLPFIENYVPIRRKGFDSRLSLDVNSFKNNSVELFYGFTKERVKNKANIDLGVDAVSLAFQQMAAMNHYISFAEVMSDYGKVFNNGKITQEIKDYNSSDTMKVVNNFLDSFKSEGSAKTDMVGFVDKIRGWMTTSRLAVNAPSAIKQLASFPAMASNMPTKKFFEGFMEFANNPKKAWEIVTDNPYIQIRMQQGYTRDTAIAMAKTYKDQFSGVSSLPSKAMILTRYGDVGAIVMGGYSVYKYHYDTQKSKGASHEEADDIAKFEMNEAVKLSQQDKNVESLSDFERGNNFQKLFTSFKTSQFMYFRQERKAIRDLMRGHNKKDALKRLLTYHVVLPVMFEYFTSGLPGIMSDWDEDDTQDIIRASALGSFNGIFIVSDLIQLLADNIMDKPWTRSGNNTIKVAAFGPTEDLIGAIAEFKTNEEDVLESIIDVAAAAADFRGLPASTAQKYVKNYNLLINQTQETSVKEGILIGLGWSPQEVLGEDIGRYIPGLSKETLNGLREKDIKLGEAQRPKNAESKEQFKEYQKYYHTQLSAEIERRWPSWKDKDSEFVKSEIQSLRRKVGIYAKQKAGIEDGKSSRRRSSRSGSGRRGSDMRGVSR